MANTLVVGFGSEVLSDERIVLMLLKDLELELGNQVKFKSFFIQNIDLLYEIGGYEKLFIIDTTKLKNYSPGHIHFWDIDSFQHSFHLENFHENSFKQTLELGHRLDIKMPSQLLIAAIEIEENKLISNNISLNLSQQYNQIYAEIYAGLLSFMTVN